MPDAPASVRNTSAVNHDGIDMDDFDNWIAVTVCIAVTLPALAAGQQLTD